MQSVFHRLGQVNVNHRIGLAVMTSAALLPVGLSAIGNADAAKIGAFVGIPVMLSAALLWRGGKMRAATKARRRIIRQKQAVAFVYSTLLFSLFVQDWSQDAAIYESVALNKDTFHREAVQIQQMVLARTGRSGFLRDEMTNRDDGCSLFSPKLYYTNQVALYHRFRAGLVTPTIVRINGYGDVSFYTQRTDSEDRLQCRLIYTERGPSR